MYKNHFVKFPRYACFFDCLDKGRRIGPRSGRAGPSFSARPEKEAKGAVLHGTSAAERLRHVHNFGNPHRNSKSESDKAQISRSDGNFPGHERPCIDILRSVRSQYIKMGVSIVKGTVLRFPAIWAILWIGALKLSAKNSAGSE